MTNVITIPPEAVEALRAALTACDCDDCVTDMIRAALNAWPGVNLDAARTGIMILHLPQKENTNAEG